MKCCHGIRYLLASNVFDISIKIWILSYIREHIAKIEPISSGPSSLKKKKNRNQYQGLTSLKIKRVTSKKKESSGRWNTHTIKSIWLLTLEIETATLPPLFRPSLLSLLVWWQRLATWQSFHRGMTKRFFLFKRGALAAAAKRGPTNIFCCWIESPSIQHPNQHQNFGFLFLKYIQKLIWNRFH